MKLDLTLSQEALIGSAIKSGRFHNQEDAGREALAQWEEREHKLGALRSSVDEAQASIDRGDFTIIATEDDRLDRLQDIEKRGRARMAEEKLRR